MNIIKKYKNKYSSKILDINNNTIGEFEIKGKFNSGKTISMEIRVDEQYQGLGLSRILIRSLCNYIKFNCEDIRMDQLLFIDMDASDGFWEYIGMKQNRYGIDYQGHREELEGVGYEMYITFRDLYKWAN